MCHSKSLSRYLNYCYYSPGSVGGCSLGALLYAEASHKEMALLFYITLPPVFFSYPMLNFWNMESRIIEYLPPLLTNIPILAVSVKRFSRKSTVI